MINFLHIPKAGGLSLKSLIDNSPDSNIIYYGHVRAKHIPHPSFCFVRNPYDRIVSTYFYLTHENRLNNYTDAAYRYILLKYVDFKDFIMHIESDGLNKIILHIYPMSHWICDEEGKIIVDDIFKIEEIEKINAFLTENGISEWMDSPKKNTSEHEPYESYLDPEIIAEIERLYELDFKLFNYEKC